MNYIVRKSRYPSPDECPCVVVVPDYWDDFGYKTTFEIYYYDETRTAHELGQTKILQRDPEKHITELPKEFTSLGENFCSLGIATDFYERCAKLGREVATSILSGLRDIVIDRDASGGFKDLEGYKVSLLRFSESQQAFNLGPTFFGGLAITDVGLKFSYQCQLTGFSSAHNVNFDFTEHGGIPHRMMCFVGKNGAGKSGVLSKLATALSGWGIEKPEGIFSPGRPIFERTLCFSYSIFQAFTPPNKVTASYCYSGLQNNKGEIDIKNLDDRIIDSFTKLSLTRNTIWDEVMALPDLLGNKFQAFLENPESFREELKTMSSGQRIAVSMFTDLAANITDKSLVLFDEPETYLHPTLLSTFLRLLHEMLEKYDSYGIVATHSPIVVQEVPACAIRVFEKVGDAPYVSSPGFQTLGANLTEIVDQIFVLNEKDKNYKNILEGYAKGKTFEEFVESFEPELSLNARMYILNWLRTQQKAKGLTLKTKEDY